ncbi:alpha/beta fold hydrolase [Nocardia sp. NPDC058058]|uniref:alpha/beta fold hydrolase n=1 Tax=Nocardia sp. NPDC058058 TaxID=3346317 RepID=UPI0036DF9B98
MRMKLDFRWRALALTTFVVAAFGFQTTGASLTAAPPAGLDWAACPADASVDGGSCATLPVPMNYSEPDGARIEVMVSRIPARDPVHRQGVLFGNPGGPGADALGFWSTLSKRVPELRDFDLIAVQPRGLRWSTPLNCSSPVLDGLPVTVRLTCEAAQPGYPATITTESVARDMEQVRQALGEDRISFLGVSWGTYLGALYGTLVPEHTDKLVLDSNVDPQASWSEQTAQVPLGVSQRLDQIFDWVAANDAIYSLGSTRQAVLAEWNRQIDAQGGGWYAPSFEATTFAAYSRNLWPYLAQGMRKYRDDPRQNEFLKYLSQSPLVADPTSGWMRDASRCNEDGGPNLAALTGAAATLLTDNDLFRQQAAVTGSGILCAGWPSIAQRVRVDGSRLALRPLLLQSEHDPATSGATALATAVNGTIIWVGGGDHGQFGRDNPVLNNAVVRYLQTGTADITAAPEPPITTANPPASVPGPAR